MPQRRQSLLQSTMDAIAREEPPIYADSLATELKEGDVLIFRGKKPHDAMIRFCTGSEYNHVGIVVEVQGELELGEGNHM